MRIKTAPPEVIKVYKLSNEYRVECPHCSTLITYNELSDEVITVRCRYCHKAIKLDWDNIIVKEWTR